VAQPLWMTESHNSWFSVQSTFARQISTMMRSNSTNGAFSETRFERGFPVSTVYWGPRACQPVSKVGCGPNDACCEVFVDGPSISCGTSSSATFVLLQNASAGVTLRFTGGDRVKSGYGGTNSTNGGQLCFQLNVKCNPLVKYYQFPRVDVSVSNTGLPAGDPCLHVHVESLYGCVK
jgi:hypothetical protein